VLTGHAPRVGRNCQSYGEYTSTLEFRLLKTSEVTQLAPKVENLAPEPPPSDLGGPKLPDTARPAQMAQTPTVEEEKPKVSSSAAGDTTLPANSLKTTQMGQSPSMQEPKFEVGAASEKKAITSLAQPLIPPSPQEFRERNFLAPTIIALNAALPLFSLLFLVVALRSIG